MDLCKEIRSRVAAFCERHDLLAANAPLCVGFSGGADSTALVLILESLGAQFTAVHLHHGMRGGDADADAAWSREFCRRRGIPFEYLELAVPQHRRHGESLEEAARRCRLGAWRTLCPPAARVALGHHADDCLEDVVLRLGRGSNSSGLTGLRPLRCLDGTTVVRPLLCLRRGDIEAFLAASGIFDWRRDASNGDSGFIRNRVRHDVMPRLRAVFGHDRGLLRALDALRDDAEFLEQASAKALDTLSNPESWRTLHPALLPRVLRLWLREQLGHDAIPNRSAVERLREALLRQGANPQLIPLGSDLVLRLDAQGLQLCTAPTPPLATRSWNWRQDRTLVIPEAPGFLSACRVPACEQITPDLRTHCEVFAESALESSLVVRAWQPGDRIIPFGRHTPRKIQDIFTEARIVRGKRRRVPLVLCGETVIWVAGVRRAEFGRLQPGQTGVSLTWNEHGVGMDLPHEASPAS